MKYAALAVLFTLSLRAQLAPPATMALDSHVPVPPTPVAADGRQHLAYELHLTNFRGAEVTLKKIEVLGDDDAVLFAADDLLPLLSRPGQKPDRVLTGGTRAILFLWVTADRAPETLRHRVHYALGGSEATIVTPAVNVSTIAPPVLDAPLRGDRWVATYGPSNAAPHRRTVLPMEGAARIPQRFATDWVRLGPNGLFFHDDIAKNENWYGYGAEVHAVADGVIAATRDGIPDNVPPNLTPGGTFEDAGGNHVILDLGDGRYAFFAHLKPGSVRVKKGDRVKRGDLLGRVGNSGNSMGAHLHFHVSRDPRPLTTEGVPYVLRSFVEMGRIPSSEALEMGTPWTGAGTPVARKNEMPLGEMVVRFD